MEDELKFHGYNKNLQPYARKLRGDMTKAQACLWKYALRAKAMRGFSFRRERPVLNFIADFMCMELMLVIEVDGSIHLLPEIILKDKRKNEALKAAGFRVLRFTNEEVLTQMNAVIEQISFEIDEILAERASR